MVNTCIDSEKVNELYTCDKAIDTIVLEYYPYKN